MNSIEGQPASQDIGLAAIDAIALDNIKDVGTTLVDSILAPILEHSILESIPVVGIAFKMAKTGAAIRDRLFLKKLGRFLLELQDIAASERATFVEELDNDPVAKQKVGENLILLLDRFDDVQKASLLGQFFKLYMNSRFDYHVFRRYSMVIDRAYLPDLESLVNLSEIGEITEMDLSETQMQALYTLGLTESTPVHREISPSHKDYELLSGSKMSATIWLNELGACFRSFVRENK
jgi:hypothetical protein